MSATITGLGSGFDITAWVESLVSAKKSTLVTPLETKKSTLQSQSSAISSLESKYSTLKSALQTFTKTIYNSSSDMWNNATVESSNSSYATAVTSGNVQASSVELEIEQIATATTAKSIKSLGTVSKDNIENTKFSKLANGLAKSGDFSMFVDGKEYKITIGTDDTVKDVMNSINEKTNGLVQANVSDDGRFEIYTNNSEKEHTLSIGSSADTSNFAAALKLHDKYTDENGNIGYQSSYVVSTVNTSEALTSEASGLGQVNITGENGKGKVTINGEDFEINENTTLNQLISSINANSDVNVKATYDSLTNKLILTSTETGENNISLSEEGTNLLNVLGLTEYQLDSEGNKEEIIANGSQELGQNAIAYVNGNKVISASNTITGESSGISNLSITIKKPTSEFLNEEKAKNAEKSITLDINRDFTEVTDAINTFVSAYNDVVSTTKSQTTSTGTIGMDSSLTSILSKLRGVTSQTSNNKGVYSMLADIGITTSSSDLTTLTVDSTKLEEALNQNFESVKLLLSDGYMEEGDTGIFDKMLQTVSNAVDPESGYFTQKSDSLASQIKTMTSNIERANTQLTNYETRITKQFNAMDSTIASLNSQLSYFSSIFR